MDFNFYSDPGHAWLRVPLALLAELGVSPSEFSYHSNGFAFLEEDLDAGLFLDAWKKVNGREPSIRFMPPRNSLSRIRNMARFIGDDEPDLTECDYGVTFHHGGE